MRLPIKAFFKSSRLLNRSRLLFLLPIFGFIAMAPFVPPKNAPPNLPLLRINPQQYEIRITVRNKNRTTGWPVLPQTNWSYTTSAKAYNLFNNKELPYTIENLRDERQCKIILAERDYTLVLRSVAFESSLNTEMAEAIRWPTKWIQDVSAYLKPSRYIESEDKIFRKAIQDCKLPQNASIQRTAKAILRYCLENIQSNGSFTHEKDGVTTGIKVTGALHAIKETQEKRQGSAADLVCVCVATLRAANIPARPVIGVTNSNMLGQRLKHPHYTVWGEYHLPDAGWVPFITNRMSGSIDNVPFNESWQGLGSIRIMNKRVPLAYNFECFDLDRATQEIQMTYIGSVE